MGVVNAPSDVGIFLAQSKANGASLSPQKVSHPTAFPGRGERDLADGVAAAGVRLRSRRLVLWN